MPKFEWDPEKARRNLNKHKIAFEDAVLVWSDPLHITRLDRTETDELRWQTIGTARGIVLIVVVHTYRTEDVVRVISARKATSVERRAYEDGDD